MDPLDARIRCLEMAIDILSDSDEALTADKVFPVADELWAWATDGLYQTTEDENETRQ